MLSTSRKRAHDPNGGEEHTNQDRWLLTYSDMITLLMVLFIMLFAISQVDQKKFDQFSEGLAHQFGTPHAVLPGQTGILASSSNAISLNPTMADPGVRAELRSELLASPPTAGAGQLLAAAQKHALMQAADFARAKAQILAALHQAGLDGAVSVRTDQRGLTVSVITDRMLFAADLAVLAPAGRRLADAIAPALKTLPNDILVEGHTNNVAVTPKFYPTEWELSSARAVTVVRYLIEHLGLKAKRLGAVGYADQRPLLPASDPASVSVNRRVDIVVLSTLTPTEQGLLGATKLGS